MIVNIDFKNKKWSLKQDKLEYIVKIEIKMMTMVIRAISNDRSDTWGDNNFIVEFTKHYYAKHGQYIGSVVWSGIIDNF